MGISCIKERMAQKVELFLREESVSEFLQTRGFSVIIDLLCMFRECLLLCHLCLTNVCWVCDGRRWEENNLSLVCDSSDQTVLCLISNPKDPYPRHLICSWLE
jgi:hypothetical protein